MGCCARFIQSSQTRSSLILPHCAMAESTSSLAPALAWSPPALTNRSVVTAPRQISACAAADGIFPPAADFDESCCLLANNHHFLRKPKLTRRPIGLEKAFNEPLGVMPSVAFTNGGSLSNRLFTSA